MLLAKRFAKEYGVTMPLAVDVPPANAFDNLFAAWPVRYFVLKNGNLIMKPSPTNCEYSLVALRDYLLTL